MLYHQSYSVTMQFGHDVGNWRYQMKPAECNRMDCKIHLNETAKTEIKKIFWLKNSAICSPKAQKQLFPIK